MRHHVGVLAQRQRQRLALLFAGLIGGTAFHPIDGERPIELCDRSQRCNARVEVCAAAEFDAFHFAFLPVRDGDGDRNAKIARHVEHQQAASLRCELRPQILDVVVAKFVEVDLGAVQAVVPPDRAGIPLDEFQEALDDRFLKLVARSTAVRVGTDLAAGSFVKKIQEAGREDAWSILLPRLFCFSTIMSL